MSDHHVRWSSFIGEHHYVDHIYYMIHARPFGLCVPRPYLYMLGSSSITWVFRVCNCFAPVVFERRTYHTRSSRGVSARRTFATVHTQGEHFLIISERSSYNATVKQSKIRCIKKINITCNQYKWYDMAIIILCLSSPSSKHRHDHHHHWRDTLISIVASLSLRHLLLLRLSLPLSDKVKQLQGVCISYNKATTIWLLPVADNFGYKTWSSHTIKYSITSWPYHITTCPAKTS